MCVYKAWCDLMCQICFYLSLQIEGWERAGKEKQKCWGGGKEGETEKKQSQKDIKRQRQKKELHPT